MWYMIQTKNVIVSKITAFQILFPYKLNTVSSTCFNTLIILNPRKANPTIVIPKKMILNKESYWSIEVGQFIVHFNMIGKITTTDKAIISKLNTYLYALWYAEIVSTFFVTIIFPLIKN